MSNKGRLKYVGKQSSGISLYAYGSYKQITLSRSQSYVFTNKDRLDAPAIAYYRKFRPMGVELELLEEPTPTVAKLVEEDAVSKEVLPESIPEVELVEEEPKDLYEILTSKTEEEVYSIFSQLGFKSRKKSLSSKISDCIANHADELLNMIDK